MDYTCVTTIRVTVNDTEGKAMIGGSWPVSMISPEFARFAKITFVEDNEVYRDQVHFTELKTKGKALINLKSGGAEINLCVLVTDLAVDVLLGLDALSRMQGTIQIGVGEYSFIIPDNKKVTQLLNHFEPVLHQGSRKLLIYDLFPKCLICEQHSPAVTVKIYDNNQQQSKAPTRDAAVNTYTPPYSPATDIDTISMSTTMLLSSGSSARSSPADISPQPTFVDVNLTENLSSPPHLSPQPTRKGKALRKQKFIVERTDLRQPVKPQRLAKKPIVWGEPGSAQRALVTEELMAQMEADKKEKKERKRTQTGLVRAHPGPVFSPEESAKIRAKLLKTMKEIEEHWKPVDPKRKRTAIIKPFDPTEGLERRMALGLELAALQRDDPAATTQQRPATYLSPRERRQQAARRQASSSTDADDAVAGPSRLQDQ